MEVTINIKNKNVKRIIDSMDGKIIELIKESCVFELQNKKTDIKEKKEDIIKLYIEDFLKTIISLHENYIEFSKYQKSIQNIQPPVKKEIEDL